jgi:wobble nucleotide-excising tRNase
MLASHFENDVRSSKLEPLDPFLHQYESEYHYLFKHIHEEANRPARTSLEAYYGVPNVARRLLEAFLAFRVPDKPGDLFQKLEAVSFDQAKKIRVLRFLHTYSHLDRIADPEHDVAVLSEAPAVLKDLLELIRHTDPDHFTAMVALVSPPPSVAVPASPTAGAAATPGAPPPP